MSKNFQTHRRKNQISIFQHLREQKALLVIELLPSPKYINITNTTKTRTRPCRCVDGYERIPRPVAIHRVAGNTVSVVIRLDDLGPRDVVAILDPETILLVKGRLGGGQRGRVPGENFGADAGGGGDVGRVAAVDEGEAEFDVVLAFEDFAAEEEVAAIEAGEML